MTDKEPFQSFLDQQVQNYAQLCIRQIDRCMTAVNRVDFTEGFSREKLVKNNVDFLESLVNPLKDEEFETAIKEKESSREKLAVIVDLLFRKGVLHIRYTDESISDSSLDPNSPFPFSDGGENESSITEELS